MSSIVQPDISYKNISDNRLDTLTPSQQNVLRHMLKGDNILLTGGGGVGKSYLLSVIYTEFPRLKKEYCSSYNPGEIIKLPRIQMCAMTGCASLLLSHKAKTLHSWAGIGLGKGTVNELCSKISRNNKAKRNWLCTDILIIDEISMMTAELLDKLNELGKKLRSNKLPFGGIQVLLVGDFYQLPPVNRTDEETLFAFDAKCWKELVTTAIELTEIKRQKDEKFQTILKEARIGELSDESCKILEEYKGRSWKKNKIRPTLIFPRRAEVDLINDANLKSLKGKHYKYKPGLVYDGKTPDGFTENDENFKNTLQRFDNDASYIVNLELALNAQVMLISNIDPENGLVNGSRGVITGFCPLSDNPIVEFINGIHRPIGLHNWPIEDYEFVSRSQIPLKLAYANTTHKLQGSTLDSALIDIGNGNFEFGQAYVALSRVKDLTSLYVYDFDKNAFKAHSRVKEFYKNLITEPLNTVPILETIHTNVLEDIKEVKLGNLTINSVIVNKKKDEEEIIKEKVITEESNETITDNNWLFNSVPDNWTHIVEPCRSKLLELSNLLETKEFLPPRETIWKALELTSPETIKVVILGQDPYPTRGNAHGLAFSVLPDVRPIPASLKNIYKELASDIGFTIPNHGNLEEWAKQGLKAVE